MNQNEEVYALIIQIANEFNEQLDFKIDVERGRDAPLYGRDGVLDSMGLVSFIAAVEQSIEDNRGISLTLADERALSQRRSPFRTIGTLADYVAILLEEIK